jgi:hypothetical protein
MIMRFFEFKTPSKNKSSDSTRYNTEIGVLVGLIGAQNPENFNPQNPEATIPRNLLSDPDKTYSDIKRLVSPAFDPNFFSAFVKKGQRFMPIINKKMAELGVEPPTQYNWAGGKNKNDVTSADVEFVGCDISGISVKGNKGITLNNLKPASLGLEKPAKGVDVFAHYAEQEFNTMKKGVFAEVLNAAKAQPNQPLDIKDPKYTVICIDPQKDIYRCTGGTGSKVQTIEKTGQEILGLISKNAPWQRPFGDYFVKNWETMKGHAQPLINKLSVMFKNTMVQHLSDNEKLTSILKFADQPFFYTGGTGIYFVPSKSQVSQLEVKDVKFAEPDGATMMFYVYVGLKSSQDSARVEVHVRYANGMFQSNPTVRVQGLKDPQNLSWEFLGN